MAKNKELTMRELRKLLDLRQATVAARVDLSQGHLSRIERGQDCRVSTLRRYVTALGGELEIRVHVGGHNVRLKGVGQ